MHAKVLLFFTLYVIALCLWLMPTGTEAYPNYPRNGHKRCPPTCSMYCQCGHVLDANDCPICRCRPSNICTGRHPNAHPRHRQGYGKSQILY
ncbi:unnamed protein product [Adineta steineri]|uniref:Antistasin-like domain-containing protein n=1 Tax=Adineta steineri TaxID=433720 RepID=A0A818JQL4_9BILA|nr:unnamed protein product [Adineta steineri]CAF1213023.1 unnamed protein product [Adineta steineri]CAF1286802.1 unnamed protein product [Adineta steineri]CAF1430359.1 unnamed protein product [Adineta steineri]CAF3546891.1 unnamed protein product [Adineta steineri]